MAVLFVARLEAAPKAVGVATTYTSGLELREARRRHVREPEGPKDKLAVPLTTHHVTGWTTGSEHGLPKQPTLGRVKCEETKYAEELLKSGVFY